LNFSGQGNGVIFSTAGSATITNNNNMSFNDYSTAASATINNTSNGNISFNDDSMAGNSNITNNGNLVFNGQVNGATFSTAGSATITNNSSINFNDYSTAGNANITSGYILDFNNNSTAGFANIVNNHTTAFQDSSTAGNAIITNNASLNFSVSSTAGNAVIVNNSAMAFSGNSTAGNATITTNSGDVFFETAASGGTAQFVFNGTGYLDISGETPGTAVTIGSLKGSGSVSLGANNLTIGANNLSASYAGIIADSGYFGGTGGSLSKIGTGTLTLSGNNSYTGGTDIVGGTLVAANGSALGSGLVDVNGGTLSMSGPLTLNIGGSYTQTSGTLQLGLGGTTTGLWDTLNVTGSATLGGNLKLVSYNQFQTHGGETFELLNSTVGLNDSFGVVTDLLLEPVSIVYTSNEVLLETLTFSQFALTPNQAAVAGGLDNLTSLSANSTLLNALDSLPTSSLPAAYDQISPSNLTPLFKMGFMAAQAQGGFIWQRLSQYWGNGNSNSPYAALDGESPMFASTMSAAQEAQIAQSSTSDRWGVFASGMGTFGTVTSDGNGAGYQFSTGGTTAGLDYRFSKDFVGGLLFGYDQSGTSQSTGTVNATSGQVGLYAGLKANQFHIEALVDGGLDSYATQRNSFGGTATGNTSGMEYTGQLNMGFDFKMADFKISPFAAGQYTEIDVNGFSETGSLAPLTYGNQGESYLSSDLGSQFSLDLKIGGMHLLPNVSGAWEHVYQGNVDSLTANFGTGSNFTVDGSATGTDAAVVGGGLNAEFSRDFSVYAEYQGKMGMTNYTSQSFTGGINLFFGGSGEKVYGDQTRTPNVTTTASPVMTPSAVITPVPTLPNLVFQPKSQEAIPAHIPTVQTTASPVAIPSVVVSPVVTLTPVTASNATPIVIPAAGPAIISHSW